MIALIIIFAIILICFLVLKKVYEKNWDKNLKVEVLFAKNNVHEGECSTVKEIVINDKYLPLPTLETRFYMDKGLSYTDLANAAVSDKTYRRDIFAVGIKRKISRTFEIRCEKRGYYVIDKLEIISADLFLLQKFLSDIPCFQEFYVYPRRVNSNKLAIPYQRIMGDLNVKKKLYEDPFAFAGIRDYVPSDPMNKVNWKASAKSQDLVVNVFDSTIEQKVVILVDTYENRGVINERLNEEVIRLGSALAERFLVQGVEISIIGNGQDIVTKERFSMLNQSGVRMETIKQAFSRLERVHLMPITDLFEQVEDGCYVICVSKNAEIAEKLEETFENYFWIVPYQGDAAPQNVPKGKYYNWEIESHNVSA